MMAVCLFGLSTSLDSIFWLQVLLDAENKAVGFVTERCVLTKAGLQPYSNPRANPRASHFSKLAH